MNKKTREALLNRDSWDYSARVGILSTGPELQLPSLGFGFGFFCLC